MNTRIVTVMCAVLIAANLCFGRDDAKERKVFERRIESAKKNLIVGLRSQNRGVVEASVKMTASIKLLVPSEDMSELEEELNVLSTRDPSPIVRYKAYIASSICSNPEWFVHWIDSSSDDDAFYINAGDRLRQKLFGMNAP